MGRSGISKYKKLAAGALGVGLLFLLLIGARHFSQTEVLCRELLADLRQLRPADQDSASQSGEAFCARQFKQLLEEQIWEPLYREVITDPNPEDRQVTTRLYEPARAGDVRTTALNMLHDKAKADPSKPLSEAGLGACVAAAVSQVRKEKHPTNHLRPGLNMLVRCPSRRCPVNQQLVWINRNFGRFYVERAIHTAHCPACPRYARIEVFMVYQSVYSVDSAIQEDQTVIQPPLLKGRGAIGFAWHREGGY